MGPHSYSSFTKMCYIILLAILICCQQKSANAGWITTRSTGLMRREPLTRITGSASKPSQTINSMIGWNHHSTTSILKLNSATSAIEEKEDSELPKSFGDQMADDMKSDNLAYGLSDDEFEAWIANELATENPWMAVHYPDVFQVAPRCITLWRRRYRGNPQLWKRIFKRDRVVKEFLEAAPILQAVVQLVDDADATDETGKITIMDLASGKGYLSMILSELLPPDKITKIVLVDKAWAMCGSMPQSHHMNWDHIYGNKTTIAVEEVELADDDDDDAIETDIDSTNTDTAEDKTYFSTWPIPLHTSKQDLKQKCNLRQLKKRFFDKAPGPVIVLAIHLCGLLSLRAVDIFNDNPDTIQFMALKPCCLPTIIHANRDEIFEMSNGHSFDSKLVCSNGKFRGKKWNGPPRWHLESKFNAWADNLFLGMDAQQKVKTRIKLQQDGGYQNVILFAQREPITTAVWDELLSPKDGIDDEGEEEDDDADTS